MNFLLKIVEGPNKGAEVALVDGVAVTLGKGDECDIVLADSTMPEEQIVIEATEAGVSVGGEVLEPFHVKTVGATSFAVGPGDAPWGELVWPGEAPGESPEPSGAGEEKAEAEAPEPGGASEPKEEEKPRRGCLGCLVPLFVVVLVLAALAWLFRDHVKECDWAELARSARERTVRYRSAVGEFCSSFGKEGEQPASAESAPPCADLPDVASKYGLALSDEGGVARLSGDFKTRRERLAATAEAYAARPGVELDFSDDESLRASAEDALFTLTEGALRLSAATNRFLKIVGRSPSAAALKKTLKALDADMPKLVGVDVTGVTFGLVSASHDVTDKPVADQQPRAPRPQARKRDFSTVLPVCGILTVPYPCLITRDGRRYHEGASLCDSVIVNIGADSVVLTNSTGRFTWKP